VRVVQESAASVVAPLTVRAPSVVVPEFDPLMRIPPEPPAATSGIAPANTSFESSQIFALSVTPETVALITRLTTSPTASVGSVTAAL
jgi:hypothetical protein